MKKLSLVPRYKAISAAGTFVSTTSLALFTAIYTYQAIHSVPELIPFLGVTGSLFMTICFGLGLLVTHSIDRSVDRSIYDLRVARIFTWLSVLNIAVFIAVALWFCIAFIVNFRWTAY